MWNVSCLLGCCVCLRGEWWLLNVRKSILCVRSEVSPFCFLIVRECVSVMLKLVFGACVDCCGYGKKIWV